MDPMGKAESRCIAFYHYVYHLSTTRAHIYASVVSCPHLAMIILNRISPLSLSHFFLSLTFFRRLSWNLGGLQFPAGSSKGR